MSVAWRIGRPRRQVSSLTLAVAALALSGGVAMSETLAGSEWVPIEIQGAPASDGSRAFVRFGGEGRLSGNSGCNRFTGSYEIDGVMIRIGPGVAMTRMACPPAVMEEEMRLIQALEAARGFARDGISLDLTGEDGVSVLRMRQTDWD
jgi:heat shock protein HslJ